MKKFKLKTKKAVKKRFKITAKGKVKSSNQNRRHLLGDRNRKVKRQNRKSQVLGDTAANMVKACLPYG